MARILIVEDDENITKMIEAALSIVGHTFASCADGKSAVDMILYGGYDLVLLDIMPVSYTHLDVYKRQIMEWSKTHVYTSLYVCWGAFAGLYYNHGIDCLLYTSRCV